MKLPDKFLVFDQIYLRWEKSTRQWECSLYEGEDQAYYCTERCNTPLEALENAYTVKTKHGG